MSNNGDPDTTDSRWSIGSQQEMEYTLNSLRLLVCELLKTNQELREALQGAKIDPAHGRDLQPNTLG